MVLYDYMPPVAPSPPSPPPAPGGKCKIHIHHTIGCYNDSDWQSGAKGLLLPAYQASVHGKTSLETCACACHAAKLTVAGVNAGSDCFCGAAADLNTAGAMARNRPKVECMASVCDADPTEKECGGPGRLLAYQFTCDPAVEEVVVNAPDTLFDQHNPPYSFAMRIDVPLKSDDDGSTALQQSSARRHAVARAAASCSKPADCSLAGTCLSHPEPRRCVCDKGFTGPTCSALDLSPSGATRTIAGLPKFQLGNTTINTVWGGHSVRDAQGRPHWFGSIILNGGGLGDWTDGSAAGHAVAKRTGDGTGPFKLTDVVLRPDGGPGFDGGSIHGVYLIKNPTPWPNRTDAWLLFYTGMPKVNPLSSRKIGVAYAPSLQGPFTKFGAVLSANTDPLAVDSSSISNAAPAFDRDGSGRILLAYKGLGKAQPSKPVCTDGSGKACISVAEAAHWTGPYRHVTADAGMRFEGEDACLWQGARGWHMVFEHYTKDRTRSGAHAWSADGLRNWTVSDNKTWVALKTALDRKETNLYKRERYQVVLGSDGHPSLLFNGAGLAGAGPYFNIVTPFAG